MTSSILVLCLLLGWVHSYSFDQSILRPQLSSVVDSWCPLPQRPVSADDGLHPSSIFTSDDVLLRQVERLSAAVNVPTVSYEDNGAVGVDPRWEEFGQLHKVLERLFPLVHRTLALEKVNTYGLIYTLQGTSKNLKPILFAAHQDVVPADSPSKWQHDPFSAYFDGQLLWGRGSSDCKNNLIGLLSVMESLVEQDFKPARTILLAFGFDEEVSGNNGAGHISKHLEKVYGKDSIAMIMDEGGMGIDSVGDMAYARPAVAEKGFLDIVIDLDVNGGHSSKPPNNTGIGIAAEMVVALEAHPYLPVLHDENPLRGVLECQVRYSPGEVESWLQRALIDHEAGEVIGPRLAEARGILARYAIQTSQAVDIIRGGSKDNQLPDSVSVTINYRIAPHDSVEIVEQNVLNLLGPIAKKHNLAVRGFGVDSNNTDAGALTLSSKGRIDPAPISPTRPDDAVWQMFSGTVRKVFEEYGALKGKTVVPVGDIMLGNTDTKHYWNLSRNIYRFSPARDGTRMGIHTVNERLNMSAHVDGMRLYYELMRNFAKMED